MGVSAPDAKMPGFGTYFEADCDVVSAEGGVAELACDGGVGEVTVTVDGIEGLDLADLPDRVVLDIGQTSVPESSGSKHSISTRDGSMLLSYVGVAALEVLDDPWPSILPIELDWALRDCPDTSPQTGVTCSPAMLVVETPGATSEAPAGETSAVAGGWHAFVSALAQCVTEANPYGDEVRFAIVSDTLL